MKDVSKYPTKHGLITEEKMFLLKEFNQKAIERKRFKEHGRSKYGLPEKHAGIVGTHVILGEQKEAEETKEGYKR